MLEKNKKSLYHKDKKICIEDTNFLWGQIIGDMFLTIDLNRKNGINLILTWRYLIEY